MKRPSIKEMRERAQRQLDGMVVNRDAMARDVLTLADALEAALSAQKREAAAEGFAGAFNDVWSGIFKEPRDGSGKDQGR